MTQHNSISRNEWRGLKRIDFIKSRYGSWPPQLRAAGGKRGLSHGYSRLHIFRAPPRPHSRGTQTASQSRGHNLQLLLYARRVQSSDLYWVQLAQQALGLVSDLTTQHPQKRGESGPSYGLRPAFSFSSYSCPPPIRVPAQSLRLARAKGLVPGAGPGSEAGGSRGRPGTRRGSPADPRLESEATPPAKPTLTACSGRYIH